MGQYSYLVHGLTTCHKPVHHQHGALNSTMYIFIFCNAHAIRCIVLRVSKTLSTFAACLQ